MKKIIVLLLLIGVAVGAYYGYSEFNRGHEDIAEMKADETVTAKGLMETFQQDESAANTRFNGKVLEVSGKVVNVRNEEGKNTTVLLDTGDPMAGVSCELAKGATSDLKAGDETRIRGECTGLLMDVVLVRCVVVE